MVGRAVEDWRRAERGEGRVRGGEGRLCRGRALARVGQIDEVAEVEGERDVGGAKVGDGAARGLERVAVVARRAVEGGAVVEVAMLHVREEAEAEERALGGRRGGGVGGGGGAVFGGHGCAARGACRRGTRRGAARSHEEPAGGVETHWNWRGVAWNDRAVVAR